MDLRLEMLTVSPAGVARDFLPIERPNGFDDEAYRQHASCAAELIKQVLSGEVDYRHRASDGATTTMMVVDETVPETEIDHAFQVERDRQYVHCEWSRAHLIQMQPTSTL